MYQSPSAALRIVTSNNDGKLRLFDADSAALLRYDIIVIIAQGTPCTQDAGF